MSNTTNNLNLSDLQSKPDSRTILISFLAVLVGIIAGFGAIGFRYLIGFFHNLFFLGKLSFHFNSELPFQTSWGVLVILVPAVGITIANMITEKWAPEAKGHGVPEVMAAVMENKGKIRPKVSIVKSFASAITIGSGGSVGREGPIVQIGASFGSTLGQLFRLKPGEVIVLVGAGVAGGIGATFNAPIGGIMFALELILPGIQHNDDSPACRLVNHRNEDCSRSPSVRHPRLFFRHMFWSLHGSWLFIWPWGWPPDSFRSFLSRVCTA